MKNIKKALDILGADQGVVYGLTGQLLVRWSWAFETIDAELEYIRRHISKRSIPTKYRDLMMGFSVLESFVCGDSEFQRWLCREHEDARIVHKFLEDVFDNAVVVSTSARNYD